MNEDRPESDFPPGDEKFDDRELEALLRRLEPSPLDVGFLDELHRDHDRLAEAEWAGTTSLQWKRLIPLSMAALVVFASYVAFRYAPLFEPDSSPSMAEVAPAVPPGSAPTSAVPTSAVPTSAVPTSAVDGFVPVSAQGYLVRSSPSGVIETEEGPRERWNLEFRDAYHWHDPETDTNIRFFEPRNEEVILPLQTD